MRFVLGLTLMALVACTNPGGTNPPPPPPPAPDTLYGLLSTPKNVATGSVSTKPDELWVNKGQSITLTLTGQQKSILTPKIEVVLSGSDGVDVTPTSTVISGNDSANFTVSVPSGFAGTKPFFYFYGYPLDKDDRRQGLIRLDYKWDIAKPVSQPYGPR